MSDTQREILDVDFLFVGGGPAGISGAVRLAQLCGAAGAELPQIAIVEKAREVGGHQMSGAVLQPESLRELFPDFLEKGCPMEAPVSEEILVYLTQRRSFRFPILPPQMKNHGNYVVSLSRLTRWLGDQAAGLGINFFTGFAATEVLYEGDRVIGVRTGDKGVDAKGQKKGNFEAGVDIRAKCTVLAEGVRGCLAKTLVPKLGLDRDAVNPATFETGVKEVWECPPGRVKPGMVLHSMGYPLSGDTAGGAFLYGMKDNLLTLGLVVSLDYKDPFLEPHRELQRLKEHPFVAQLIQGGKSLAYGAKAVAAGGYYSVPRLYFNGGMLLGDSGQLLDIARLKGIHAAMKSGILAAETIFETLNAQRDFSAQNLEPYQRRLLASDVGRDLRRGRNFHAALSKGMPWALPHLALQTVTGGRGFVDPMRTEIDRAHYDRVSPETPLPEPFKGTFTVDKLTSVFNSGTLHEEDSPCHLKVHDLKVCYEECVREYRFPCNRFCPAGVYEMLNEAGNWRLQVNFTNCVHCQTCDIKCPKDNITWTPPEGAGGPRYTLL